MIPFFFTFYRFGRGIWHSLKDPEFEALFTLVIITLLSGMLFYHAVEGWGYLDSLYFSVTTLTTVGYGDFHPVTVAGKIFTMVYLFIGIGVLLGFINAVAQQVIEENKGRNTISQRLGLRKKEADGDASPESESGVS